MSKFLRIGLLTMLMLVLVAGTALAGTVAINGTDLNGFSISSQALGTVRNVVLNGPSSAAIKYTSDTPLQSTNLINVSYGSGVKFEPNKTVYVCTDNADRANSTAGSAGTGSSGSNDLNIQLSSNVTPANVYYITTRKCSDECTSTGKDCAANVQFAAQASGIKAVNVRTITSGGIAVDSGSNNIANIANEFTPKLTTGTVVTIDYTGPGANGKKFEGGKTVAQTSDGLSTVQTSKYYGVATNIGPGAGNAENKGLSAKVAIYLKDSANWQGVSNIFITGATGTSSAGCTGTDVGNTTPPTTGTATVNASNAFSSTASSNIAVCIKVDGNTTLQTRTIKAAYKITWGSDGVDIDKSNDFENFQIWEVNAYQGLITWLVKSDGLKTYCLVHNNSAQAANVQIDTFSGEQGSVINSLSLGSIGAGKSQLYIFGDQVVAGSSTYDLTGIQANERYSVIKTVTTSQDQVAVTCNQFDPAGAKRLVPVLTGKDGPKWKN